MKRFSFLAVLLLLLSLPFSANSQIPYELGTKWYHLGCCGFTEYVYEDYTVREYVGDSIIDGLAYHVIPANTTNVSFTGSGPVVTEYTYPSTAFFHQEGDQVLEGVGNDSFLFMDYSAEAGAIWEAYVPYTFYNEPVMIRIDSTAEMLMSGQMRRISYASFQVPSNTQWYNAGPYAEGLGRLTGPFTFSEVVFPFVVSDIGFSNYCSVDVPSSPTPAIEIEECTYNPVGLSEEQLIPYRISENPSDGRFDISLLSRHHIDTYLYTADGRRLSPNHVQTRPGGLSLDIRDLSEGIYLLVLIAEEEGRQAAIRLVKR